MSNPKYFEYFPTINYPISVDKSGKQTTVETVDYYNYLKIQEDVLKRINIYQPYTIKEGQRPEQVAFELYEDERYYWTILHANKIIDFYNEWPMTIPDLDEYILRKYGSYEASAEIRHYETLEVKDQDGNVLLQPGIKVSEDFVYRYPSYPGSTSYLTSFPVSVTHRQYEYDLNTKKSQISVLKPEIVLRLESEIRRAFVNRKS